jgi:hypothetical protein
MRPFNGDEFEQHRLTATARSTKQKSSDGPVRIIKTPALRNKVVIDNCTKIAVRVLINPKTN